MSVDTLFARMSPAQKAGQVMMIGFDGAHLSPETREAVAGLHPGGVVIFERNAASPRALAELIAGLQAVARENGDPPLLVAVDQEGGRVARLKEANGFTEFPSAMAVAASGDVENARRIARAMAAELVAAGINMDLAPDLDINNNPANPVIGIRSFGDDPKVVAAYGAAFAGALQAAGVMAVGKHFPGHGDTATDSHVGLPVVPHHRQRLEAVELLPFRAVMSLLSPGEAPGAGGRAAPIAGIMSAHMACPALEPTPGLLATLSRRVLTGLLRDEMGYHGLILTDSLEMGALAEGGYPVPLAAVTALAAGADLLTFNRGHELHRQAHAMILDWVGRDLLPRERLDAAVRRVLATKERFGLLGGAQETRDSGEAGRAERMALSRQISARAITLLRDDAALLPLRGNARPLTLETPAAEGLGKTLAAAAFPVAADPTPAEITAAVAMAVGRTVIVATADANRSPGQVALVRALLAANAAVIVVAVRGPYDLLAFEEVPTYLATYGSNPPAFEALADVLNGVTRPQGRLPVDLPGLISRRSGLDELTPGEGAL